jgi:hypothetical protein
MTNTTGYVLLAFLCCIWPLISGGVAISLYRRWQRHGLSGFIPRGGE